MCTTIAMKIQKMATADQSPGEHDSKPIPSERRILMMMSNERQNKQIRCF